MNSRLLAEDRRHIAAGLALGLWAAAIAVVPGLLAKGLLLAPALLLPFAWWLLSARNRWVMVFFAAALLLPPLPFAMGNSGPHPSLLVAGIGVLAGLLWLPEWRIPIDSLPASLLTLSLALAASVAQAALYSGATVAAASLARVALFGISVYVFFYTVCGSTTTTAVVRDVRRLYWMAAAAALFACVDFYFQLPAPAGYGAQFVWLDSGVYRRAQGLFYEASTLGNFCVFFLVMIAAGLQQGSAAILSRKAMLAGGIVLFAALLLSYSRGSLVNLAIALSVLLWRNRGQVRWIRVALLLAILTGAGALITWKIFPAFAELSWLRISATTEFLFSATEGVLSGRLASWRMLTGWIAAHPWQMLLGVGYKTLPSGGSASGPIVADNMYLSMLVETGIFGLAALLWLHVAILRASGRAAGSSEPRRSFLGTWIHCFWVGQMVQMLSGDLLTYWRVMPVYLWVLALAVRG